MANIVKEILRQAVNGSLPPSDRLGRICYICEHAPAEPSPYSFEDWTGRRVDWSSLAGEVYKQISGHERPITKEELAVICARKNRESQLVRALLAMHGAGETERAITLVGQVLGGPR